MTKMTDGKW